MQEDYIKDFDETTQPMTLKNWLVTMLLLMIPIVNIVLVFVWAFGSNVNKSKKTFFQAQLIMSVIVIVLWLLVGGTLIALFGSM